MTTLNADSSITDVLKNYMPTYSTAFGDTNWNSLKFPSLDETGT